MPPLTLRTPETEILAEPGADCPGYADRDDPDAKKGGIRREKHVARMREWEKRA
jgi:hypothetical protein